MRGEQPRNHRPSGSTVGPSPRARGAAARRRQRASGRGTIPACAGSSSGAPATGAGRRDHPRVRGEQRSGPRNCGTSQGPSPRARGAGKAVTGPRISVGTIPACAGSRTGLSPTCPRTRDHPRVRGEQRRPRPRTWLARGPSPRARGAVPLRRRDRRHPGTIPACAGSSLDQFRQEARNRGPSPRARGADSLNWEFTSGKQPNFQLPEKQTFHPQSRVRTIPWFHTRDRHTRPAGRDRG